MNRRQALIGSASLIAVGGERAKAAAVGRGLWRDSQGFFGVGAFPEFGEGLFGFDYTGGLVGPLRWADGSGWTMSGALDGGVAPVETLRLDEGTLLVGPRRLALVAVARRAFNVASAGLSLSAEMAVVEGDSHRGAVLMIYGSGPAAKAAFDPWALWFLGEGFAVITYDKRGSGNSAGDWRLASLEDLAADAVAVLGEARALGLKGRVFAWGASQGGWILPQLGAAMLVDGLIMQAGAATTPEGQILDQVTFSLKAYGFDRAEIERAKAYYALDIEVSRGRRPWSDIDAAYKAATAAGAEWILEPPAGAAAAERTMIRLMADFDPGPFWRKNSVPVLALYGEKDWIVPAETNLPRLNQLAPPGARLDTQVIPEANHLMFAAKTGNRDEYPKLSRLAPDYFPAIGAWLGQRT